MNRRRMLSSVHRRIARNELTVAVHQDATTIQRMSIADLDRIGPRLVTTFPVERPVCAYGCGAPASDTHFPYCSAVCGINAERS